MSRVEIQQHKGTLSLRALFALEDLERAGANVPTGRAFQLRNASRIDEAAFESIFVDGFVISTDERNVLATRPVIRIENENEVHVSMEFAVRDAARVHFNTPLLSRFPRGHSPRSTTSRSRFTPSTRMSS